MSDLLVEKERVEGKGGRIRRGGGEVEVKGSGERRKREEGGGGGRGGRGKQGEKVVVVMEESVVGRGVGLRAGRKRGSFLWKIKKFIKYGKE